MWYKQQKKTIFVLEVENYSKEIVRLTRPILELYAQKIGATIYPITTRKFPDFPPVYEKLQIFELGQELNNDWNIYIDSDAIVHPETMDVTTFLKPDTIMHHGTDFAQYRWSYDQYFLRDGRHIGSCNWFTVASSLCIDLWRPLDDLTMEQAVKNIHPIVQELDAGIEPSHLIDDYTLSRNIAKYGLKALNFLDLLKELNNTGNFFFHEYMVSEDKKVHDIKQCLRNWNLARYLQKADREDVLRMKSTVEQTATPVATETIERPAVQVAMEQPQKRIIPIVVGKNQFDAIYNATHKNRNGTK